MRVGGSVVEHTLLRTFCAKRHGPRALIDGATRNADAGPISRTGGGGPGGWYGDVGIEFDDQN